MKSRILTFLAFAFPCVVLFAVHFNALRTWFFMDDFAWLGLFGELRTPGDVLTALFEPRAQGTVRVLSERLFFIVFKGIFGMKAGPFHYWVFLTQCGSLVLTNAIVRRLSGSWQAGLAAATAWALMHGTAVSMAWLSAYNEILCGFCMLAAFYCLVEFVHTGERRFWVWQWVAYLTGFLALEVSVVYPAVACLFVWIAGRQYFRRALWLWVPALAFTGLHFLLIPKTTTPVYKMTFDLGILTNLGHYAFKAVGPTELDKYIQGSPGPWGWWIAIIASVLLVIFLSVCLLKREWLPLMGLAWFVLFFAPLLPLQNHVSEYYTTIPSFGFAMLIGCAFASAVRASWAIGIPVILFAGVFVYCEAMQTVEMEQWYRTHSGQMHTFLNGIDELAHRREVEAVFIAGVDDELYISGLLDDPFRLYGIRRAYLLPGSEAAIHSVPKESITLRTDHETADRLIASGNTIVAAFDGRGIVDVTNIYRAMLNGRSKWTSVQTVDPVASSRLGPGWHDVENGFRWMPRKATVKLDVPDAGTTAHLIVSVYCPQMLIDQAGGKLELRAWIDGKPFGTRPLPEGRNQLEFDALSKDMAGRKQLEITLEVSHVVMPPGDGRELGVPVFEIALRAP